MIELTILLDVAPLGGGIGLIAAAAFFLIFVAIAFIAFKLLRKTFKMAVRMMIVLIILAIAIAGSISLWTLGNGGKSRSPSRPRYVQPR